LRRAQIGPPMLRTSVLWFPCLTNIDMIAAAEDSRNLHDDIRRQIEELERSGTFNNFIRDKSNVIVSQRDSFDFWERK
jgi:hypothetical protein